MTCHTRAHIFALPSGGVARGGATPDQRRPGLVHHREIREITLLALCPRRLRPVVAAIAALVAAGLLASS
ncbi:MAG: hypothetical protein ABSH51_14995, partial [Solirubrobacteraceae bacterium]